MKKILCVALVIISVFVIAGCSATKTLHCDNCDKEVVVKESSNMDESWDIYCNECNEELFGDNPVLNG